MLVVDRGPLEVGVLSPAAREAAATLLEAAVSPHTRRAYQGAVQYWEGWYGLRYGAPLPLPVSVEVVLQFINDHIEKPVGKSNVSEERCYGLPEHVESELIALKIKAHHGTPVLGTVTHRIAVLSKLHQVNHLVNPVRADAVKDLLRSAQRSYAAHHKHPMIKKALTLNLLRKLIETCEDDLRGRRDRALLLLAFASGGRRRSEVAALQVKDLCRTTDGNYLFELNRFKTSEGGPAQNTKPVNGEAAEALTAWLTVSRITAGPVFRQVIRGEVGGGLSGDAIRWIVRRRAQLAGLSPRDFSAHSLRSGFVTEAGKQGVPIGDVMRLTDHRSLTNPFWYYRAEELKTSAAANLLSPKRRT